MRSLLGSKQFKTSKRLLLVGLPIVVSFCVTLVLLQEFLPDVDGSTESHIVREVEKTPVENAQVELPNRISISHIRIDASIKPVGITEKGDMAVDESISNTFWYSKGPRPGEVGSAVIAGHYGWKDGKASVFNNVHTLKKGDKVSVYDKTGKRISFIVQKTRRYEPGADAKAVFRSDDGKAHLNLITCDGVWNSDNQTYSKRLVVFTDKET